MAKVEIREFGRGRGGERDAVYEIGVGKNKVFLFEADNPPSLRQTDGTTVEFDFSKEILVINNQGNLVKSPHDIKEGGSVNMSPFNPLAGKPPDIPDAKITHLYPKKED